MKHSLTYLLFALALIFASCAKDDVSFTYSPTEPRAGQSITFTNNTSEGEEWKWDFGDGNTSASKSPVKVYKKPGTYTVILKVDDKASRTYSATITVYDTIPAIGFSDSIVYYMEPTTLTAQAYNPYGYTMTYDWHLPAGTLILDGDTTDKELTVCFTQTEVDLDVRCEMMQGTTPWTLDSTIYIHDTEAPGLMLGTSGKILRQRIYDYGFEDTTTYACNSAYLPYPSAIWESDDYIYVFNDDQTKDAGVARLDPLLGECTRLIRNKAAGDGQGMEKGYLQGETLYWVTGDYIYKASCLGEQYFVPGASSNMLVASIPNIGYGLASGLKAGGIAYYNGTYMLAYGKGIWRFTPAEIGKSPAEGAILSDYTITDFTLDPISQKIYFCTTDGLYISNFDGSSVVLLDAAANGKGIAVDNADNLLFWNTDHGVFYMPLIQSRNNIAVKEKAQLNNFTDITCLGIDTEERGWNFDMDDDD